MFGSCIQAPCLLDMLCSTPVHHGHGGLSGYVDDLYVKPEFRRMGAGDALLNELFAECLARGCKFVHVEVGGSNAPALALYARFGLLPAKDGRVLLSGPLIEGDK